MGTIAGFTFAIIIGLYLLFTDRKDIALVIAIFTAIVSPIIFYFKIFSKIDYSVQFQKIDKSYIVYSGLANHFKNGISVGGKLYLLNDKLIFQTNVINYTQRHEQTIDINEVTEVIFVDTMGFINNGLCIKINNNENRTFVVNKRKIWKEEIEKLVRY